jgi:hypothetical protein
MLVVTITTGDYNTAIGIDAGIRHSSPLTLHTENFRVVLGYNNTH